MPDVTASRRFTGTDQAFFARLSGDANPMHMDALAARRTQAGVPVVHGIHALLWVLDAAAAAGLPLAAVRQIKVQFTKFIPLDREVTLRITQQDAAGARISVAADGVVAMALALRFGPRGQDAARLDVPPYAGAEPAALSLDQMAGLTGWLSPPEPASGFDAAFPHAAAALSARLLSGLAQTSRLVGMVCPGLHSIYAGLTLDLTDGASVEQGIGFRVTKVDERFRLVDLAVQGAGLAGKISAFARHPPVAAPAMEMIASQVVRGEFSGVTALVAGGSRGLGAVTAKIIAAGGGRVAITYATGRADAEAVRDDIDAACGAGTCTLLAYDALLPAAPQLASVAGSVNAFYYFATPQIFAQQQELFSAPRLAMFTRVYVEAFNECCQALARDGLAVFYPSSVAVSERPAGMLEYSMAKMAGEMLGSEMQASGLRIVTSRLPRILTDQTATVARVEAADAVGTMVPLVREASASF